jgi:hypothetical protein
MKKWLIIIIFLIMGTTFSRANIIINNNNDINVSAINNNDSFFSVLSPTDTIFFKLKVDFRIQSTIQLSKLEYINLNDKNPRWKTLCTNCEEYGISRTKKLTFSEGKNQIVIRGYNHDNTNVSYYAVLFYVDSYEPNIFKYEPREGKIFNGSDFSIFYTSENLQNITLTYGKDDTVYSLTSNCVQGKKQECHFNIDLSQFNNEEIYYNFTVKDFIYTKTTETRKIKIDNTIPVLTINFPVQDYHFIRIVPFNITISKKSTLQYLDNSDRNPAFRNLCVDCSDFGFFKKRTFVFEQGLHELVFRVIDKSGNSDIKIVNITSE